MARTESDDMFGLESKEVIESLDDADVDQEKLLEDDYECPERPISELINMRHAMEMEEDAELAYRWASLDSSIPDNRGGPKPKKKGKRRLKTHDVL